MYQCCGVGSINLTFFVPNQVRMIMLAYRLSAFLQTNL